MNISPDEQYKLQKLQILTEVQDDLVTWSKKKLSVFAIVGAIIGVFGASSLIKITVGEKIESEMKAVDARVLDAVKSAVEAETSAKQVTEFAKNERIRLTQSANKLSDAVSRIQNEANKIEVRLKKLSSSIEGNSENVREEAHLLAEELEKRIKNMEDAIKNIATSLNKENIAKEVEETSSKLVENAEKLKQEFDINKTYEIQIQVTEKNMEITPNLKEKLRTIGYLVTTYNEKEGYFANPDSSLVKNWGIKPSELENRVTVMYADGNLEKANSVALEVKEILGLQNVQIAVDTQSKSPKHIGILLHGEF